MPLTTGCSPPAMFNQHPTDHYANRRNVRLETISSCPSTLSNVISIFSNQFSVGILVNWSSIQNALQIVAIVVINGCSMTWSAPEFSPGIEMSSGTLSFYSSFFLENKTNIQFSTFCIKSYGRCFLQSCQKRNIFTVIHSQVLSPVFCESVHSGL